VSVCVAAETNSYAALTAIAVDVDVFVTDEVLIVVHVANHNRQRVGSADRRMSAVLHDDRQVELLLCLAVEVSQAHHDAAAVAVIAATLAHVAHSSAGSNITMWRLQNQSVVSVLGLCNRSIVSSPNTTKSRRFLSSRIQRQTVVVFTPAPYVNAICPVLIH